MTTLIVTIVVAWLVFSTILVVIICMNSSRLSGIERVLASAARARQKQREKLQGEQDAQSYHALPRPSEPA